MSIKDGAIDWGVGVVVKFDKRFTDRVQLAFRVGPKGLVRIFQSYPIAITIEPTQERKTVQYIVQVLLKCKVTTGRR